MAAAAKLEHGLTAAPLPLTAVCRDSAGRSLGRQEEAESPGHFWHARGETPPSCKALLQCRGPGSGAASTLGSHVGTRLPPAPGRPHWRLAVFLSPACTQVCAGRQPTAGRRLGLGPERWLEVHWASCGVPGPAPYHCDHVSSTKLGTAEARSRKAHHSCDPSGHSRTPASVFTAGDCDLGETWEAPVTPHLAQWPRA